MKIDFKIEKGDNKGIYHSETERILIYPPQHENIEDMLDTITHEIIHHAIDKSEETIDEDQEEKVIFCLQWAKESLI